MTLRLWVSRVMVSFAEGSRDLGVLDGRHVPWRMACETRPGE